MSAETTTDLVAILRQVNDLLDIYRREATIVTDRWRSGFDDALTLSRLSDMEDEGDLIGSADAAMVRVLDENLGASISDPSGYTWEAFHAEVYDLVADQLGLLHDPSNDAPAEPDDTCTCGHDDCGAC